MWASHMQLRPLPGFGLVIVGHVRWFLTLRRYSDFDCVINNDVMRLSYRLTNNSHDRPA